MSAPLATTRWSVIKNIQASPSSRKDALAELYRIYWAPICGHLRRLGIAADEVEDTAQDFFLNFFDGGSLDRADRDRGRFRSYLLGALRFHAGHHFRKQNSKVTTTMRGHGNAEELSEPLEAGDLTRNFDVEWARAWFAKSLARFAAEVEQQDREPLSDSLRALVLGNETQPRHEVATSLGLTTGALASRVHRLRRRFREILRDEALRTVNDEWEADAELRYLLGVLGATWE